MGKFIWLVIIVGIFLISFVSAISWSGGGGSSSFIGLDDTPSSYTGSAGLCAAVNAGETDLEFIACGGGGGGGGLDGSNVAFTNRSETWNNGFNITMGTNGWFFGLFNWVIDSPSTDWLSFNGSTLTLNETRFFDDYYNKTSVTSNNKGWLAYDRIVTGKTVTLNFNQ